MTKTEDAGDYGGTCDTCSHGRVKTGYTQCAACELDAAREMFRTEGRALFAHDYVRATQDDGTPDYCYLCGQSEDDCRRSTSSCACGNCSKVLHASDCAVHNMPAEPNGFCDCGVTRWCSRCGAPFDGDERPDGCRDPDCLMGTVDLTEAKKDQLHAEINDDIENDTTQGRWK